MGRLGKSVVYGGLFTFWIMCFAFGFSVLSAAFKGEDVVAAAGQSIVSGFALWFICSFCFYELQGWIEERNKPREFDEHGNNREIEERSKPRQSDFSGDINLPENQRDASDSR